MERADGRVSSLYIACGLELLHGGPASSLAPRKRGHVAMFADTEKLCCVWRKASSFVSRDRRLTDDIENAAKLIDSWQ